MKILRNTLIAAGAAVTMAVSTLAFADASTVEAIKLEVRQLTGVTGSYDPDTKTVTLSGFVEDMATFNELISRIKKLDNVDNVRSSVFHQ